ADLARTAGAVALAGSDLLPAGSAGLAAHLPAAWGLAGRLTPGRCEPVSQPVLVVAGSPHPSLVAQERSLRARPGLKVVGEVLAALAPHGEGVAAMRAGALAAALTAGEDALLTTCDEPHLAGGGRLVASLLAEVVSKALAAVRPGALVLSGGDVAVAVCGGLGAAGIVVEGELEPGVPFGRLVGGTCDGLRLVTKAGGFGDGATLCRVLAALRPGQNGGRGCRREQE
ncbi:MAG: nucleotide-binding domain containing protein, partial [Anaerolineae bacterium]|nr:nucleotide-binding domain containing protein [Anaerolineae bacterium]